MRTATDKKRELIMKIILLCLIIFFSTSFCSGQDTTIKRLLFTNKIIERNIYIDSNYIISNAVPLEVENLGIKFFEVTYDKNKKEFHISGQICYRDTVNCEGLQGVEIFLATCKKGKLVDREEIGESSFKKYGSVKNGLFNIRLRAGEQRRVYFYFPFFYTKEYDFKKLLMRAL
ncbi:MAG: hypothetical protein QM725_12705 [Lacibacter sp.]